MGLLFNEMIDRVDWIQMYKIKMLSLQVESIRTKEKMSRRETISHKKKNVKKETREIERTYPRTRGRSKRNDGESHPIVFSISHSTALSLSAIIISLSLSDLQVFVRQK